MVEKYHRDGNNHPARVRVRKINLRKGVLTHWFRYFPPCWTHLTSNFKRKTRPTIPVLKQKIIWLSVMKLNRSRTVGWVLSWQVRASRCVNYSSLSATPPDWVNITSSEGLGLGASHKLRHLNTMKIETRSKDALEVCWCSCEQFWAVSFLPVWLLWFIYRCTPLYGEVLYFKVFYSILESKIGEEGSDKTIKTNHSSGKLLKCSTVYSNSTLRDCSLTGNHYRYR